jgi:four helix bundle protein
MRTTSVMVSRGGGVALAERFEDLRAWQAARALTIEVYSLARTEGFGRDFGLVDQIRRAAVSTMNNIAEGFDSASRVEFARFLRYASRSASEVQSCLHVALDQNYITRARFDHAYASAASVRKLSAALTRSLRSREPRVGEPDPPAYGSAQPCSPTLASCSDPLVTGHRSPVTPF